MTVREQLKSEIELMDDRYLELAFKVICQFPHAHANSKTPMQRQRITAIFQEMANDGGLGISDPLAWQREVRQDRTLPFRNN